MPHASRLLVPLLLLLGLLLPVRADDPVRLMRGQADDLVKKALDGNGGEVPDTNTRANLLHQADEILKHLPPGNYHDHRKKARGYISTALFQLKQGDVHQAEEAMRDADREIRTIPNLRQ